MSEGTPHWLETPILRRRSLGFLNIQWSEHWSDWLVSYRSALETPFLLVLSMLLLVFPYFDLWLAMPYMPSLSIYRQKIRAHRCNVSLDTHIFSTVWPVPWMIGTPSVNACVTGLHEKLAADVADVAPREKYNVSLQIGKDDPWWKRISMGYQRNIISSKFWILFFHVFFYSFLARKPTSLVFSHDLMICWTLMTKIFPPKRPGRFGERLIEKPHETPVVGT